MMHIGLCIMLYTYWTSMGFSTPALPGLTILTINFSLTCIAT